MRRVIPRGFRWLTVFVVVVIAGAFAPGVNVAAKQRPTMTIVVHVRDYANVREDDFKSAQDEAARIYKAAGIHIVWMDPTGGNRADGRAHFDLVVLNREMAERLIAARQLSDYALGQALRPAGRAWVLYHRVVAAVDSRGQDLPGALGRVIAHEVGHLVLPVFGHSVEGIMRADLDLSRTPQRFSLQQAQAMRARLEPDRFDAR